MALVLVMLAMTASGADDVGAASRASPRVLTREGEGRKAQWAPTRNFLRLNTRFVLSGESERRTSPYGREGRETAAGGFVFAWDVDGRLVSATTPQVGNNPGIQADYEYDGLGLRRQATVVVTPPIPGAVTTSTRTWTWGGADGEEEVAEDSNLTTHVAGFRVGDGPNSFTHDGLGSVVTQTAGGTTTTAQFSTWGTRTALGPPLASSSGYTGHRVDEALELIFAGQRWLDPRTGTWLSRDPVGAASYLMRPNELYAFGYAAGNPTRYTDPDGRAPSSAEQCRALEQRGVADMASCMKGVIRPNRKRYFAPTSAAPAPVTEGPQAVVEGAAERAASIVTGPTELVVQAFGYDADFNVISPDQRQQAQAQLKELNDALRKRALFPALLVSDAFSGGGTAIAELGSAMADNDMRAAGGATFDVATQVPFLFEGGLGAGRLLTPAESLLAQPARSVLNPSNWSLKVQPMLAAGPLPPLLVPRLKYTGLLRVRRAGTFIADLSVQPTLTLEQRAAQLQTRAAELQNLRSGFTPELGTTAAIEAEHIATGNRRVFIATNGTRQSIPTEWASKLEPWETFVPGSGHAEPNVLSALGPEWRPIAGGSSRNICWLSCAWELGEAGLGLGGPVFPGVDKSGHRMFWVDTPPSPP